MKTEEVARSVRLMSLGQTYEPFDATELQLCENMFQSCTNGKTEKVQSDFEKLGDCHSLLIQPLSVLAAKKGKVQIFQFCFSEAVKHEVNIDRANEPCSRSQTISTSSLRRTGRNIQNTPKALRVFLSASLLTCKENDRSAELLRWVLDHGVKISWDDFQMMGYYPPPFDVVKFLLVSQNVPEAFKILLRLI